MCNFTARIKHADGWEEVSQVSRVEVIPPGLSLETLFDKPRTLKGYRITLLDMMQGQIHLEPEEAS
ncbi:CooT family nickel-binding protein [Ferrimonas aestuarii]|uniref:CooT family nickel-binding protein n=1 Tax=Ferrimonas aestuarii TaxID=2569539 RepID=A0A4U1BSJ0_9GAMM|nr:CooT family nickel-binding protein [Ferrimonas aestuarii]TKB58376.1 CooT family nickel-binding protein [Ferrimonas aestuarii]